MNRGFSLFEVLVAIFILSFGLLGIVGIYIQSFKRVEDSFRRTLEVSESIAKKEEMLVRSDPFRQS